MAWRHQASVTYFSNTPAVSACCFLSLHCLSSRLVSWHFTFLAKPKVVLTWDLKPVGASTLLHAVSLSSPFLRAINLHFLLGRLIVCDSIETSQKWQYRCILKKNLLFIKTLKACLDLNTENLLIHIKAAGNMQRVKSLLKTQLFSLAFNSG